MTEQAHAHEPSALHDGDPETSHEAAKSITPEKITEQKTHVLAVLQDLYKATDKQIIRRYKRQYPKPWPTEQSIRSRRAELTKTGHIEWSGEWVTTEKVRERLWQLTGTEK